MSAEITLYSTNDIHGRFLKENNAIDFSRLATLKSKTSNCLLVDAGDATQGTPLAIAQMGLYPIKIMNSVGYDLMTVGNHEFDNITKDTEKCELDAIIKEFKGTYLAANLMTKDGKNYINTLIGSAESQSIGRYEIRTVNGKNLLFIGIVTPDMSMNIKRMEDFKIGGIDSIAEQIKQIINNAKTEKTIDAVIVIAHLGLRGNTTSTLLAKKVDGIDLIIDGHSHDEYNQKAENGKTLIVQAGCYGQKFSKITLKYDDNNKLEITAELLDAKYLENNAEQNEGVIQKLNEIQQQLEKDFGTQWSSGSCCTLWGGALNEEKPYVVDAINIARYAETNMGELVSEAMIKNTIMKKDTLIPKNSETNDDEPEYIVAAINGGSLRESIAYNKPIRSYELFTVLPSPLESVNESGYYIFRITLGELKTILENSVSSLKYENGKLSCSDGRFLNVSGLEFTINYDSSTGITIDETINLNYTTDYSNSTKSFSLKKDSDKTILFCTTKYLGSGGDGYSTLKKKKPLSSVNTALFRVVGEYISSRTNGDTLWESCISKKIKYSGFNFSDPNEVKIKLVDKSSNPLKNQVTAVKFNRENKDDECSFFISDDDGYITLTPPSGNSILEILVMLPFNDKESYNNLYCELYFHTYYIPDKKELTACCSKFDKAPRIQEKLSKFSHTHIKTHKQHFSNYINYLNSEGWEKSFLIYDNKIYDALRSEGEYFETDFIEYAVNTQESECDKADLVKNKPNSYMCQEFSFTYKYDTWGEESYESKLI